MPRETENYVLLQELLFPCRECKRTQGVSTTDLVGRYDMYILKSDSLSANSFFFYLYSNQKAH